MKTEVIFRSDRCMHNFCDPVFVIDTTVLTSHHKRDPVFVFISVETTPSFQNNSTMTVGYMQLINKEKISLRWTSDDSSTASSEAEITTNNTLLKTKSDEPVLRKSGKSIRFAEDNEYYEIDHIDDLDKKEVENTWYTVSFVETVFYHCHQLWQHCALCLLTVVPFLSFACLET